MGTALGRKAICASPRETRSTALRALVSKERRPSCSAASSSMPSRGARSVSRKSAGASPAHTRDRPAWAATLGDERVVSKAQRDQRARLKAPNGEDRVVVFKIGQRGAGDSGGTGVRRAALLVVALGDAGAKPVHLFRAESSKEAVVGEVQEAGVVHVDDGGHEEVMGGIAVRHPAVSKIPRSGAPSS